jgi:LEA14-like dessication related protein
MIDRRRALLWIPVVLGAGCATIGGDPVQVQVVGVEPLEGEGLELRFLCKLRVQNPNDTPIEYNGIYIDLQVSGSPLATGVSDAAGTVPRYGEVVVAVPVTASAFRIVREAIGLYSSTDRSRIDYVVKGKIGGPLFSPVRFESRGQLTLPAGMTGAPAAAPSQ